MPRRVYGESKIVITALVPNRQFKVVTWEKSFVCTDTEGNDLGMQPVVLKINQLEWKPTVVENYNLTEGIDFVDEVSEGDQVDMHDQVAFSDFVERAESEITMKMQLQQISADGGEVTGIIESASDFTASVIEG